MVTSTRCQRPAAPLGAGAQGTVWLGRLLRERRSHERGSAEMDLPVMIGCLFSFKEIQFVVIGIVSSVDDSYLACSRGRGC
jgi:hypothetical protein